MKIPLSPPNIDSWIIGTDPKRLVEIVTARFGPEPNGEYLHWDKLRHLSPPAGFTVEEWWSGVSWSRRSLTKLLPFRDKTSQSFRYVLAEGLHRRLHLIDQKAGSAVVTAEADLINPGTRDRYLINSLFEEAISSSQLEGAATTKLVAREMLRQGRKPRDKSEQMIVNNYRAMLFIREIRSQPLTPELIRELHRIVCDRTLDDPTRLGQWRQKEDAIQVFDHRDGTTLHVPPDAGELDDRIERLCTFANEGESETTPFVHPVLRAILLHFMVGYDHPFVDGNGRIARALFYWFMARHGYWLIEFLSISSILNKTPARYARAYLYTESDSSDMTYFLIHQCDVILKAVKELHSYVREKEQTQRSLDSLLKEARHALWNHRQTALITHAIRHPDALYTIQGHRTSHGVTYQTARADLLYLARKGLLTKHQRGKKFEFEVPGDLETRLQQLGTGEGNLNP